MEGLLMLVNRMSNLENHDFNLKMRKEVVMEVRDVYLEERQKYLRSIDPEYRPVAKKDKDMLFEAFVVLYLQDDYLTYNKFDQFHKEGDIKVRTDQMINLVFKPKLSNKWIWEGIEDEREVVDE